MEAKVAKLYLSLIRGNCSRKVESSIENLDRHVLDINTVSRPSVEMCVPWDFPEAGILASCIMAMRCKVVVEMAHPTSVNAWGS